MNQKSTNLHFMRFIAAMAVIFSHSFPIVEGSNSNEWLSKITNGQITFGGLAVAIFFLCAGYLCAKSIRHYHNVGSFILAKLMRLLPALMFVVVCSVLIGSMITNLSLKDYYSNPLTWRYLLNGVMILQHDLPGVFENAIYLPTVNGALWTLPVEFVCYVGAFIFYKMSLLESNRFYYTVTAAIISYIALGMIGKRTALINSIINPCMMFYIGMFFFIYKDKIVLRKDICIVCGGLLCISSILGCLDIGLLIFFPYMMITYWFASKQYFKKVGKLGNYSYALYLWGFPIQQFVAWKFNYELSPLMDAGISMPLALCAALITYHFVELPINKLIRKRA